MKRNSFPFSAVIGQESIKNALIWNLINPKIGGLLISGQKGTAKSTLVRGLERISHKPIVDLPLNITEDRLIGAIDFEAAIKDGSKGLDKGILALVNEGILYADEVNLLSDHIAKALLEAASEGICRVEREGISQIYPSSFILVGSMNPEEGGLKAQLLDRFGLYVDVMGEKTPLMRCEIIRRRIAFEQNPTAFSEKYEEEDRRISSHIRKARQRLSGVDVSSGGVNLAAQLAQDANCQGSRGEIAIIETARAICAFRGESIVNKAAITEAAKYALPHRMRDTPPQTHEKPSKPLNQEESPQSSEENKHNEGGQEKEQDMPWQEQEMPENESGQEPDDGQEEDTKAGDTKAEDTQAEDTQAGDTRAKEDGQERVDFSSAPFEVGKWLVDQGIKQKINRGSGRRSLVRTSSVQGRYVKSRMDSRNIGDIAFDATLRAAAPYQKSRAKNGLALVVKKSDIRVKVREKRTGNFILFAVDASGSMGVGKRMSAVKGAILSLLSDAYQKRDRVAMVTFRKDQAQLVLGMTRSVDLAAKELEQLATGGRTPLSAGLEMAHHIIRASKRKEKDLLPVLVVISDGRATYGRSEKPFEDAVEAAKAIAADKIRTVVIDVEQDFIKLQLAEKLGEALCARVYQIDDLQSGTLVAAVKNAVSLGDRM